MNWDDLRYFLSLASESSLSAAARQLKVDHTTVARRIASLEDALGLKLFDRFSHGYRLTPEGERLREQVGRVRDDIDSIARLAAGAGSGIEGVVRISAPPAFASRFLIPRLLPLREQFPGIALEVLGSNSSASLTSREADIAIRMLRPEGQSLTVRKVGTAGYGLYAARAYAMERDLKDMDLLGYEGSLANVPQQMWLTRHAAGRRVVFATNDLSGLCAAAKAGLGAAVLPHFLTNGDDELICLATEGIPGREIWLVAHEDVRRSPRVRAILDGMATIILAEKKLLEQHV